MAIAGIITFFGLLIAAYSLLKKHEKLLIKIRLSVFDRFLLIFFTIIIFFGILLSDYFRDFAKETNLFNIQFRLSFLISSGAYLVLILLIVYIGIKVKVKRLSRKKTRLFKTLVEELLNKKEYSTLIELFWVGYKRIIKFSNSLSILNSVKDKLLSFFKVKEVIDFPPEVIERIREYGEESNNELESEEKQYSKKEKVKLFVKKILDEFKHYGGKFIRIFIHEVRDRNQEIARDLLNLLLTNHEFIAKLIEFRPALGIEILEKDFYILNNFADVYLYELIKSNRSILYYEIKNNQNISFPSRYSLKEDNRIIHSLFKDCKVAQKLQVYGGIGNYIKDYLVNLKKQEFDPYNYGYENFDDTKWNSPIFIGIRFFDIMILEAIHQGIRWHMWLFYFRIFTERILKNFKIIPEVWKEYREWNSKYGYLLYEIVSTLRGWIFVIDEAGFNYKVELRSDSPNYENANVIKSSIICLTQVLEKIAYKENVPDRFKHYLADIALDLLFELKTSNLEVPTRYGNVMLNCIKEHIFSYGRFNRKFYEFVKTSYGRFDKIPYKIGIGEKGELGRRLIQEMDEYLTRISQENRYV